jgi:hypothetical protein
VAEDLFQGFGIDGTEIVPNSLSVEFGYLELSKYERQLLIRPVFIARLDIPPGEDQVHFRAVSVSAATDAPEVASVDGLGNWYGLEDQ